MIGNQPNSRDWRRGFTLLELLVAAGIFSLVVLIMSTVYTHFVGNQRRQINEQAVRQDLRFALELLQREARTGYASTYGLTDGTGQRIAWRNQNGRCVNYWLEGGRLMRSQSAAAGACGVVSTGAASLTTARTMINYLRFDPVTAPTEDGLLAGQGFITIIIQASSRQQPTSPIHLQTTVTSRQLQPYE